MQTNRPQLSEISYNPATESYQTLATFHTINGRVRVPAEYEATLDVPQKDVEAALIDAALASFTSKETLRARLHSQKDMDRKTRRGPLSGFSEIFSRFGWNQAA